jgi:uncharacterized protein (TIGR00725 family)
MSPEIPYRVAAIGAGRATPEEVTVAEEIGAGLATAGAVLVCGGLGGVMEAAARGARRAGGLTVGMLPGIDADEANDSIQLPLPTGMGEARNALVVRAAEAIVAVGGEWGTLSEIALARKMGIEVMTVGRPPAESLGLPEADSAAAAVAWALHTARRCRKTGSRAPSDRVGDVE